MMICRWTVEGAWPDELQDAKLNGSWTCRKVDAGGPTAIRARLSLMSPFRAKGVALSRPAAGTYLRPGPIG